MRKIFMFSLLLCLSKGAFSQSGDALAIIVFDKDSKTLNMPDNVVLDESIVNVIISKKASNIKDLFIVEVKELPEGDLLELENEDDLKTSAGIKYFDVGESLLGSINNGDESQLLRFNYTQKNKKTITKELLIKWKKPTKIEKVTNKKSTAPFRPINFISPEMIESIRSSSSCNLCDLRTPVTIPSRKDRKYSTNYIILYDPMLAKDAYTICKHIFRKSKEGNNNILQERYKKIGSKWFSAGVGTQIRFEVVNQLLKDQRRITVNSVDLFNTGSTQFQSIISSQVNTNIVNRLTTTSSGTTDSKPTSSGTDENPQSDSLREATDAEKLTMLYAQTIDYISLFRISSCAINQHFENFPKIIAIINKEFGIGATGIADVSVQLKNKFSKSNELKEIVDEISNLFSLLKDVKPLAYTSLRAKNRDYMEIKVFDANNVEIASENIRMSGGLKIDFSAGFVLTGLRDFSYILKDTTVQYQPDPTQPALADTSGNLIIQENTGKRQVGVGILTHIYPRISSDYNIGITVGLMSSTELDLRFMLGGSFMFSSLFGSNNRVSFSGGVVWGKVKRLSNGYYEGYKVINKKPVFYPSTTTINTVTVPITEKSWFFAVTMNFGGN